MFHTHRSARPKAQLRAMSEKTMTDLYLVNDVARAKLTPSINVPSFNPTAFPRGPGKVEILLLDGAPPTRASNIGLFRETY